MRNANKSCGMLVGLGEYSYVDVCQLFVVIFRLYLTVCNYLLYFNVTYLHR